MPTEHSHSAMVLGVIVFSLLALIHENSEDPQHRKMRFASLLFLGTLALLITMRVLGLIGPA